MTEPPRELESEIVATEAVTLERQITIEATGALISFTLETDREHPVLVRVVDEFPETIGEARWVPEFEPAERSLGPTGAAFETVVPEDESVTIQYRVRPDDPEIAMRFPLPKIALAQPIDDASADVSTRGSGTAGVLGGVLDDSRSPSAWPEEAGGGDASTTGKEAVDESAEPAQSDGGAEHRSTLLNRLISELQDPEVPEEQRTTLRDELEHEHPRSMEVRLDYLQSQVGEFGAYADTLETLIDEYGSPAEFIEAVASDQEEIHRRLDEMDAKLSTAAEHRAGTEEGLEETRADVAAMRREFEEELAALRDALDEREAATSNLREEVEAMNSAVNEVVGRVIRLRNDVEGDVEAVERELDQRVEELEARMSAELDAVTEAVTADHEDLIAEFESLEDRVERELKSHESEFSEDLEAFGAQIEAAREEVMESVDSLRSEVEKNTAARGQFTRLIENIRALEADLDELATVDDDADESDREQRDSEVLGPSSFYS